MSSRGTQARAGLAIPLVLVMLAVAGVGLMAVSSFRSSVTRQVDGLVQATRLVDAAEAALSEVASGARMDGLFQDPARQAALVEAFRGGRVASGVLTPAPLALQVEPGAVRSLLQADGRLQIGPVEVHLLRYLTASNRGTLRLQVEVAVDGPLRSYRQRLAQDHEFVVVPRPFGWGLRIGPDPVARAYP